jgi:hypothetical protein
MSCLSCLEWQLTTNLGNISFSGDFSVCHVRTSSDKVNTTLPHTQLLCFYCTTNRLILFKATNLNVYHILFSPPMTRDWHGCVIPGTWPGKGQGTFSQPCQYPYPSTGRGGFSGMFSCYLLCFFLANCLFYSQITAFQQTRPH